MNCNKNISQETKKMVSKFTGVPLGSAAFREMIKELPCSKINELEHLISEEKRIESKKELIAQELQAEALSFSVKPSKSLKFKEKDLTEMIYSLKSMNAEKRSIANGIIVKMIDNIDATISDKQITPRLLYAMFSPELDESTFIYFLKEKSKLWEQRLVQQAYRERFREISQSTFSRYLKSSFIIYGDNSDIFNQVSRDRYLYFICDDGIQLIDEMNLGKMIEPSKILSAIFRQGNMPKKNVLDYLYSIPSIQAELNATSIENFYQYDVWRNKEQFIDIRHFLEVLDLHDIPRLREQSLELFASQMMTFCKKYDVPDDLSNTRSFSNVSDGNVMANNVRQLEYLRRRTDLSEYQRNKIEDIIDIFNSNPNFRNMSLWEKKSSIWK